MMQVTFVLGDDQPTMGMYISAAQAVEMFNHVLDHAKQLKSDTEILEGMAKAGASRELIAQGSRLTMLKRQAGNG